MSIPTRHERGFTLLELVLVTAIFSVTIVMAINIFLVVTKVQRKAVSSQQLQSDARFAMELIAKDVRLGQIDYTFYSDLSSLCGSATAYNNTNCDVDLLGPAKILAVRDTEGELIVYRKSDGSSPQDEDWTLWDGGGQGLEVCIGNCLDPAAPWETITPKGIKVVGLKFYIEPAVNPFSPSAGAYANDRQPMVTMQLGTQGEGTRIEEQGYIFLQSTASTRIYER